MATNYCTIISRDANSSRDVRNSKDVGLAISEKKIIPWKTELTTEMVISDGFPAVPQNSNLSDFRSMEQK
jgi:hypothetical protein